MKCLEIAIRENCVPRKFGRIQYLTLNRDAARKNNVFFAWEASLKRGGAVAFVNRLWLAYRRSPCKRHHCLLHKGHLRLQRISTVLTRRTVLFVNRLLGHQTNGLFVNGLIHSSYRTDSHVRALFVNGMHRLATNSHVQKWEVVLPRVLRQHGELLSLASLKVTHVCTPPLTSGYPRHTNPAHHPPVC